MKIPHSGGRGRSPATEAWIAPGKRGGFEFPGSARQGAAKIVLGMSVPARKAGAARAHNGRHSWNRQALPLMVR